MKIGFDLDGTITSTTSLPTLDRFHYDTLGLYDGHTAKVWNELVEKHQVYIITARFYSPEAHRHIEEWLVENTLRVPAGIITHIEPRDKPGLCRALGLIHYFDDHPDVYLETHTDIIYKCQFHLIENSNWGYNDIMPVPKIKSWKEIKTIIDASENN